MSGAAIGVGIRFGQCCAELGQHPRRLFKERVDKLYDKLGADGLTQVVEGDTVDQ